MLLRLRTSQFRFTYTFESGHSLVGVLEGDFFANTPNFVFNLRSLKAVCLNSDGEMMMGFDTVFGQFLLNEPEVLFSGSQSDQDSFFSFNYRSSEASIYDAMTDTWIASGWEPQKWHVEEVVIHKPKIRTTSVYQDAIAQLSA